MRHPRDLDEATQEFAFTIITNLKRFYSVYYTYHGGSLGQLISENINQRSAIDSLANLIEMLDCTLFEVKNAGDTKHALPNVKAVSHE